MAVPVIDGNDFERMLKAGLIALRNHEGEINDMNVFPVSDGDTGTNMRLTLQNGIMSAESNENLGEYLRGVKKGMLLGARGNSGVILSQFFAGISNCLEEKSVIGASDFHEALVEAYRNAYGSVINPVEGTMLTVARLGAERSGKIVPSCKDSVDRFLSDYISEMKSVLNETSELLPVLKESGVKDSGGAGYICIFSGMLKGLLGKDSDFENESLGPASVNAPAPIDADGFTKDSRFVEGYCTEFILQLMNGNSYDADFDMPKFIEKLKSMGESIVAFKIDDRIKVHIHAMKPYRILELAQRYGEFVTIKIENMQVQKNARELRMKKCSRKGMGVLAVVNGDGLKKLYGSFRCDAILDGGRSMEISPDTFTEAFSRIDADCIIVIPNGPELMEAARQAKENSVGRNISILECENPVSGYYALVNGQMESDDFSRRFGLMQEGAESVDVISIESESVGRCGMFSASLNGKPVSKSSDMKSAVSEAVNEIPALNSKCSCMMVCGKNASEEMTVLIESAMSEIIPDLEINVIDGGQENNDYMIGF